MGREKREPSRRALLRFGLRSVAVAGVSQGLPRILRAGTGGRALVCLYLAGGNDGNNMVVPLDRAQYAAYANLRGALAMRAGDLLPIRSARTSLEYGMHPAMSGLRELYQSGALAIVANMGSPEPPRASLHRMQEMVFLPGGLLAPGFAAGGSGQGPRTRFLGSDRRLSLIAASGVPAEREDQQRFLQMARGRSLRTQFPATPVGEALREAALVVSAARGVGMSNPAITVPMGSFCTNAIQMETHGGLLGDLSEAAAAFHRATVELGTAHAVTLYTDSEYGRSMAPNKAGGSNAGWGNHQLVLGGSVLGGEIYGEFPDMLAGARDSQAAWVPTTSRRAYLQTLTTWAGQPAYNESPMAPGFLS